MGTVEAQLQDLGRQVRNGFATVERLAELLDVMLNVELTFFENPETEQRAKKELRAAQYFLETGHLVEESKKDG